jgi:TonB family protein
MLSHAYLPMMLAVGLLPSSAQAPALQPSTAWVVDYRNDECLASRDYASLEGSLTFAVQPAPDGKTFELSIIRPHSGSRDADEREGKVDFGGGPIKAWLLTFGSKDGKSVVYQYRISADEMSQAKSAATVTLASDAGGSVTLALKDMPDLVRVLQHCTSDLLAYWNDGVEKTGIIAVPSKGDIRSLFTADDYPTAAMEMDQQGTSQFMLMVDEKGSVAGCHVVVPSGIPVLDAMGCQVIKQRARFEPARDSHGNAIRSTVVTPPIVWRLEWDI